MNLTINTQIASLRPPEAPKFPFSSPITDEVESPTCSSEASSLGSTTSDSQAPRLGAPSKHMASVQSNDQDEFDRVLYADLSQARHEARKSTGGKQGKANSRRSAIMKKRDRPANLHVVTNFSRNEDKKKTDAAAPAFVDLNDLKSLAKAREKERSAEKIKRALRKKTGHGYEELIDEPVDQVRLQSSVEHVSPPPPPLQHASPDKYELSPSDGPIVIGLTVPYDETLHRKEMMDNSTSRELATPVTPSIVITPARENAPWTFDNTEPRQPRAASSVYSQPTPHFGPKDSEQDVPPVPAIPAFHSFVKGDGVDQVFSKQEIPSTRKQRSFSTDTVTVFDEDETPRSAVRGQSYSNESKRQIAHRLSVNTDANRHQSQGWWTYLLSPLLSRSNTVASRKTPVSTERPPVPPLSAASKESSEKWWEDKEISHFSPDTPASTGTKQTEVVSWPDPGQRAVVNPETQNSTSGNFFETPNVVVPNYELHGSAAEYYQACAHDLFSKEPYFECINHVCSMTPASRIRSGSQQNIADRSEKGLMENENGHDEKGLALVADPNSGSDTVNPNNPFFQDTARSVPDVATESTAEAEPESQSVAESAAVPNTRESPRPTVTAATRATESPVHATQTENSGSAVEESNAPAVPTPQQERDVSTPEPPPYSASRPVPRYRAVLLSDYAVQPQPHSPGPESPAMQQAMSRGSIPMSQMQHSVSIHHTFDLPPRPAPVPITRADITHPVTARDKIENRRRRLEKEDAVGRKIGGLWRGRGPFSNKGCFGRPGREGRIRRRWYLAISSLCLAIIVVAIVLATTLTRKGDATPVQSQWLNLTGYPPMPTGIMTIAGPEVQVENNGCIQPSTLWSCALPKEQQAANLPYAANQPNFRIQIRFRNGTYPNSTTIASSLRTRKRSAGMTAGQVLRARDPFTDDLFNPSPSPPSIADQTFLGNTTDNNTIPFAGEETPFYITVLSPDEAPAYRLLKRDNETSFPNVTSIIPDPSLASDGTAAAATLYPLPVSQPVRLYNRGLPTEHYGFYTYFDKSIFLKSTAPLNNSGTDDVSADQNGGSPKDEAEVRCTWAQTRFLVQIWTQPSNVSGMTLLSSGTPTSSALPTATATGTANNATSSSANDFIQPGSFPYPASIKLDRHGGDASKKMVYCYGMDANEHIIPSEKKLELEDRGFGGQLVNPAPGIFDDLGEADSDSESGIDGGTGGCACEWRNWILTA
ncbi:hypothetical protein VTN77DRAFT_6308 [Rasamsonia byssochlamydoides]|uniref:uncharacterized protein n=1 Tax=Rasamsonia byssochlamydoides TaxID=89139 RepID=UPI00374441B7